MPQNRYNNDDDDEDESRQQTASVKNQSDFVQVNSYKKITQQSSSASSDSLAKSNKRGTIKKMFKDFKETSCTHIDNMKTATSHCKFVYIKFCSNPKINPLFWYF